MEQRPSEHGGVVIAYLHPAGGVSAAFHVSLIDLLVHDAATSRHVAGHLPVRSGPNLDANNRPSGRLGSLLFPPPWPWYAETVTGTTFEDAVSEDLTFCLRAAQAGFPTHVDTRVKLGHVKPMVVDDEMFRERLPKEEEAPGP